MPHSNKYQTFWTDRKSQKRSPRFLFLHTSQNRRNCPGEAIAVTQRGLAGRAALRGTGHYWCGSRVLCQRPNPLTLCQGSTEGGSQGAWLSVPDVMVCKVSQGRTCLLCAPRAQEITPPELLSPVVLGLVQLAWDTPVTKDQSFPDPRATDQISIILTTTFSLMFLLKKLDFSAHFQG